MRNLPLWTERAAHFLGPEHRVWLWRRLGGSAGPLVFVLHNPSTAAHDVDDPTARRGIGFSRAVDASDLVSVNAATGIATDADDLAAMEDPIGPMADEALEVAAEFCTRHGGTLIAAWGAPKGTAATKRLMRTRFDRILSFGLPLHVMRLTPSGWPEHPLYLPAALRPVEWRIRSADPHATEALLEHPRMRAA